MNPNQPGMASYIGHFRGVSSFTPMMLGSGNQQNMVLPPTLDSLNEFPSLGDPNINQFSQSQMGPRTDYSGMVRDNGMAPVNQIEFNIQTEDFPALPGVAPGSASASNNMSSAETVGGVGGGGGGGQMQVNASNLNAIMGEEGVCLNPESNSTSTMPQSQELLSGTPLLNAMYKYAMHPDFDRQVSEHYRFGAELEMSGQKFHPNNYKSSSSHPVAASTSQQFSESDNNSTQPLFAKSLLPNPYGMLGLLQSIREKPFYGIDLSTLGQEAYPGDKTSFGGGFTTSLFCDSKPRVFEREVTVPEEYNVWNQLSHKIANLQQIFSNFTNESLFMHFYIFSGSKYQRMASCELYQREWRYHKVEKIWLRRKQTPYNETQEFEFGNYFYFDYTLWKTSSKEMRVDYHFLDHDPRNDDSVTQ